MKSETVEARAAEVDTSYRGRDEWKMLSKEERERIIAKRIKDGTNKRRGGGGGGGGGSGGGGKAFKRKLAALASDVIKELEESKKKNKDGNNNGGNGGEQRRLEDASPADEFGRNASAVARLAKEIQSMTGGGGQD